MGNHPHNTTKNYRARDLQSLFGISNSTLYNYIQQGILPKPIKFGRTSVWLKDEIDAVIEERKLARS